MERYNECKYCHGKNIKRKGFTKGGKRIIFCNECKKSFVI
jgi:hypothetical protein